MNPSGWRWRRQAVLATAVAAVVVALAGLGWLAGWLRPGPAEPAPGLQAAAPANPEPGALLAAQPPGAGSLLAPPGAASAPPGPQGSIAVIAGQEATETLMFRTDAAGRLVLDEQARLDVEKLFLLNEPAQRVAKQAALQASLPPAAAHELQQLMARYEHYQEALHLQLPPGQALPTRTAALAQFEQLRQLRLQYFGAPLAARLFAAEEAQQRELLEQLPPLLSGD